MKIEGPQIQAIIDLINQYFDDEHDAKADRYFDALAHTAMSALIRRGESDPDEVAKLASDFAAVMLVERENNPPLGYCSSCNARRTDAWVGDRCPDHPEIELTEPPAPRVAPVH